MRQTTSLPVAGTVVPGGLCTPGLWSYLPSSFAVTHNPSSVPNGCVFTYAVVSPAWNPFLFRTNIHVAFKAWF